MLSHRQLWIGGVVRVRNWMEDQEAASSCSPLESQSAKESKLLGVVSCTSELAAHETGNLHDIILKSVHCPLSIPQIAQLISPDTRAGLPPDPACNFVCDSHDA